MQNRHPFFSSLRNTQIRMSMKKVNVVLYSAVSSPLARSNRFTLFVFPDRPVHSDTNSASSGSIHEDLMFKFFIVKVISSVVNMTS